MRVAIFGPTVIVRAYWPPVVHEVEVFVERLAAKYREAIVISDGDSTVGMEAERHALKNKLRVASFRIENHEPGTELWDDDYDPDEERRITPPSPYLIRLHELSPDDEYQVDHLHDLDGRVLHEKVVGVEQARELAWTFAVGAAEQVVSMFPDEHPVERIALRLGRPLHKQVPRVLVEKLRP